MIKKSTVISRFSKAFGELTPSKNNLFIMGKDLPFFGLTTKIEDTIKNMILKYYQEQVVVPQMESIEPSKTLEQQEFMFKWGEYEEVFWSEDRLLAGYHILDNKPFERIQVKYFPGHYLPMFVLREIDEEMFSVIIGPNKVSNYRKNPWLDDKPIGRWIRQLPNSTFWIVEYDVYSRLGTIKEVSQIIKCYNCRAEIDTLTYADMLLNRNHAQCVCSCNTYDDFCGCIRNRLYSQMMQNYRKDKFIKRLVRRELS